MEEMVQVEWNENGASGLDKINWDLVTREKFGAIVRFTFSRIWTVCGKFVWQKPLWGNWQQWSQEYLRLETENIWFAGTGKERTPQKQVLAGTQKNPAGPDSLCWKLLRAVSQRASHRSCLPLKIHCHPLPYHHCGEECFVLSEAIPTGIKNQKALAIGRKTTRIQGINHNLSQFYFQNAGRFESNGINIYLLSTALSQLCPVLQCRGLNTFAHNQP